MNRLNMYTHAQGERPLKALVDMFALIKIRWSQSVGIQNDKQLMIKWSSIGSILKSINWYKKLMQPEKTE